MKGEASVQCFGSSGDIDLHNGVVRIPHAQIAVEVVGSLDMHKPAVDVDVNLHHVPCKYYISELRIKDTFDNTASPNHPACSLEVKA